MASSDLARPLPCALSNLLNVMLALSSADDIAILRDCLAGSLEVETTQGSSNDMLWQTMEAMGWMKGGVVTLPVSRRAALTIRRYVVLPEGVEPIAKLVAIDAWSRFPEPDQSCAKYTDSRVERECSAQIDRLALDFITVTRDAGGDKYDLLILLTSVIGALFHGCFLPDQRRPMAEKLLELTKNQL